ncbi:MAG: LysR family transcriptional regulator [Myxococcota bacterium]
MDDLGKLVLFRDVVEQQGFSRAASLRRLNHSTVSKHIKSLEATLGVTLLNRTSRSMSLTDEGRLAFDYSRRIGAHVDELKQRLEELSGDVRGELRVNSLVHVGRHVVQPAIASFLSEHTQARVWLTLDDGPLSFHRDGFDMAVRVGRAVTGSLTARKLLDNQVCLVASREFVERWGQPEHPSELRHFRTVGYDSGDIEISSWTYIDGDEFHSIEVTPVCWVNDGNGLLDAVRQGLGIGYLSRFAAHEDIASGRLIVILPHFELPPYAPIFTIQAPAEYTSPRLRAFRRHLETVATELAALL